MLEAGSQASSEDHHADHTHISDFRGLKPIQASSIDAVVAAAWGVRVELPGLDQDGLVRPGHQLLPARDRIRKEGSARTASHAIWPRRTPSTWRSHGIVGRAVLGTRSKFTMDQAFIVTIDWAMYHATATLLLRYGRNIP